MLSKMIRISIILILTAINSGCATETFVNSPVVIPARTYYPAVTREQIMQCPDSVRRSVYINLKSRDQYIETLLSVIKINNESAKQ